jgi:predicted transcriptional regulator of viral defense system
MPAATLLRASGHDTSRSTFYRRAHAGAYEKIARGLYLPADADAADWDWLEAAAKHRKATICLTSALAHYDLTDEIPSALDIAIPRGARTPATEGAIAWHHFASQTFTLGRSTIRIPGSRTRIGIYSPERCIADAFRLRGSLGYELARDALRTWLDRGGKPADLLEFASKLPRTRGPLLRTLEALT